MTTLEKTGLGIVFFAVAALCFLMVFSQNGIQDYVDFKNQEAVINEQIHVIDQENQRLEQEIHRLKTDIDYIRHLAKHEHGMAEESELIFKDNPVNKGSLQ